MSVAGSEYPLPRILTPGTHPLSTHPPSPNLLAGGIKSSQTARRFPENSQDPSFNDLTTLNEPVCTGFWYPNTEIYEYIFLITEGKEILRKDGIFYIERFFSDNIDKRNFKSGNECSGYENNSSNINVLKE